MAQLNTISQPEFTDLVRKTWTPMQDMVESNALPLFINDPSVAEFTGKFKRYYEIDTETFANRKGESEAATKASAEVGYFVTMEMVRYAKEIDISWEMRRLNQYPVVVQQLHDLAHYCPERRELDLTHIFTFCLSTTYTDMDGETVNVAVGDSLAMVSASHTLSASSTTYTNIVPGNPQFSRGALESAELLMNTNIYNNFGERRTRKFNTIVTGDNPTTVNDVKQFLQSTTDVDQNNPSVVNPYFRKYTHVMLPWMASTATGANDSTKDKYWFVVAKGQWQAYYGEWEPVRLITPSPGNNGENVSTDDWTYGTRNARGHRVVSGKGLIHSTGLGS